MRARPRGVVDARWSAIGILCCACHAALPASPATTGAASAADDARGRASVAPAASDAEQERALCALVDPARAQARVRELVAFGPRMGGTDSGARAAAYLAHSFRELGLDARIVEDSEKWCHAESGWELTFAPAGALGEPSPLASAWPYGFSPSVQGSGCLVASAGKLDEAPQCGDAAHAVYLCAKPPFVRLKQAPPALVLVDGRTTLDGSYPVVGDLAHREQDAYACFGLSRADGARLRGELAAGAHVHVDCSLKADIRRGRPQTVIASLPARAGAAEGYLLFCAHGDSDAGGPGADDNASGEATLLEIAAAWSRAIAVGSADAPARELRFAIWGSEIHSTRDYIAQRVPGEGTLLGVINYDQAGFGSGADQLHIEPDDLAQNKSLIASMLAVLADFGGTPGFPERWSTNKSLGGTDSYLFSDSKQFRDESRPALTLFTSAWGKPEEHPRTPGMRGESWRERDSVAVDYDLYYHSAGDTPENTTDKEPWNMAWCARLGILGARRWLASLDALGG